MSNFDPPELSDEAVVAEHQELIRHRLRSLRRAQGLSQRALARKAGLADSHIGAIERGEVEEIEWRTLRKLATGLGVSIQELDPSAVDGAMLVYGAEHSEMFAARNHTEAFTLDGAAWRFLLHARQAGFGDRALEFLEHFTVFFTDMDGVDGWHPLVWWMEKLEEQYRMWVAGKAMMQPSAFAQASKKDAAASEAAKELLAEPTVGLQAAEFLDAIAKGRDPAPVLGRLRLAVARVSGEALQQLATIPQAVALAEAILQAGSELTLTPR